MTRTALILIMLLSLAGSPAAARGLADMLPARSQVVEGVSMESMRRSLTASGMHTVEGIYAFAPEGAVVAVERTSSAAAPLYRIIIVQSPDRAVRPGTVAGIMAPGGRADEYDAALYTSSGPDGLLSSPRRFTVSASDAATRLAIRRVRAPFSIELHRLLPYMLRRVIRRNAGSSGEATAGCTRIFPAPATPSAPCYL